ncbi:MAG: hypothetical protein K6E36_07615 [Oscillospiraceae bacterium]|nr:hypothetical protein [Oscillospiraceae bacterium]
MRMIRNKRSFQVQKNRPASSRPLSDRRGGVCGSGLLVGCQFGRKEHLFVSLLYQKNICLSRAFSKFGRIFCGSGADSLQIAAKMSESARFSVMLPIFPVQRKKISPASCKIRSFAV